MRIQNKYLVFFFPPMAYDLLQYLFFPVNYLLGLLCYIQPQKSVWNEPGFETQELNGTNIDQAALTDIILNKKNHVYHEHDIVKLYDSLPAANARKDLIGRAWKGKVLRTNRSTLDFAHWFIATPLKLLGFTWGKRYCTAKTGDPLFLRWLNLFYIPLPLWGNVSMVDVRWRGECTATMVYDHQPWRDHFKVLSDNGEHVVLLGVWTHKHIAGGWFTLTLDKNITANAK
ncbi:DUF4334 domain-containing protein [Thalassotalea litorea]|uniref:DUF4334 domain-containing protein n=1 Tax=Thalassotalea litorea TaxID=2020715 RepID=UPI0037360845